MNSKNLLLFIGNDFVAHIFLNNFIPKVIAMGINPILVFVNDMANTGLSFTEMKKYNFYEKKLLNDILFPYIEENESKLFKLLSPMQIVKKYKLQTISTQNVNDPALQEEIEKLDFIGGMSVRCFQIFKKDIIGTVQNKGFFCNSHPGILPDYRGVCCLLRGLVNGDKKLGWTLHEINTGIDTGDVVKEISFYDFDKESVVEILAKTVPLLSNGWLEFITDTVDGKKITLTKQGEKSVYYTYPTEYEMNSWHEKGALKPLVAKEMVKFYFDLFTGSQNIYSEDIQKFKVFLINKVSQFETMMEMDTAALPVRKDIAA